tara:strand:+ start:1013 stop:1141 length:129 start_codon:yes stop_codon:yes gene_type:complete
MRFAVAMLNPNRKKHEELSLLTISKRQSGMHQIAIHIQRLLR